MANKSRNRVNQPPTGEGKKQSPRSGQAHKLHKRAEVLQASRAEQNIGSAEEEEALEISTAIEESETAESGTLVHSFPSADEVETVGLSSS